MSDEVKTVQMPAKPEPAKEVKPEITPIERIHLLANFANGVENESVKSALLALPCGDKLYEIFVAAVSKEIEHMMNPAKAAPKDVIDAVASAKGLRDMLAYLYQVMAELNQMPLLAVLNMLNQKLGGRAVPPPAPPQPQPQSQPQQMPSPQQPVSDGVAPTVKRNSDTGISW